MHVHYPYLFLSRTLRAFSHGLPCHLRHHLGLHPEHHTSYVQQNVVPCERAFKRSMNTVNIDFFPSTTNRLSGDCNALCGYIRVIARKISLIIRLFVTSSLHLIHPHNSMASLSLQWFSTTFNINRTSSRTPYAHPLPKLFFNSPNSLYRFSYKSNAGTLALSLTISDGHGNSTTGRIGQSGCENLDAVFCDQKCVFYHIVNTCLVLHHVSTYQTGLSACHQ